MSDYQFSMGIVLLGGLIGAAGQLCPGMVPGGIPRNFCDDCLLAIERPFTWGGLGMIVTGFIFALRFF